MKLTMRFAGPVGADGCYEIQAGQSGTATLRWANETGPLPGWTALARVRMNERGEGVFKAQGSRAIPPDATHAAVMFVSSDGTLQETKLFPLPEARLTSAMEADTVFAVMSDLHLSNKPWRIHQVLRRAVGVNAVLMPGDLTNDGQPEQFAAMCRLIEEELPDTPVLAVTGNHDFPLRPQPLLCERVSGFGEMQAWLLERAERLGAPCKEDVSGAYSARVCGIDVIGLNAVTHGRKFLFSQGEQLHWLDAHLCETHGLRHIILCHAPLRRHSSAIDPERGPYLNRDKELQAILDGRAPVIFCSGHTHLSPNEAKGTLLWDQVTGNLYVDDGSVVPTTLKTEEAVNDAEWCESDVMFLRVGATEVEIATQGVRSGLWIARGYGRFPWQT